MIEAYMIDGSVWRGIPGDGWQNVDTDERMTDAEYERRRQAEKRPKPLSEDELRRYRQSL